MLVERFHLEVLIFSAEKYVFRRKSPLLAPPAPVRSRPCEWDRDK